MRISVPPETCKNTVNKDNLVYPSCQKWHVIIDIAWQKRQTLPINNHSIKIMRKLNSCSYLHPSPWKTTVIIIVIIATIYWALLCSRHCAKGLKWIMPFNPHKVLRVLLLTHFPEENRGLERILSKTTEAQALWSQDYNPGRVPQNLCSYPLCYKLQRTPRTQIWVHPFLVIFTQ